jgi:hypothetical protein
VAGWLAWKLELGTPLVYNVKSTTSGRDLLYEFDELARFRDAQARDGNTNALKYLRLSASIAGLANPSTERVGIIGLEFTDTGALGNYAAHRIGNFTARCFGKYAARRAVRETRIGCAYLVHYQE